MLQGSMVALVTPMTADNQLDWPALDRLVEWHIEQGTNAIVAMGTTGESPTLTVPDHMKVVKAVVDKAQGRIPVIAGTGANSTEEAIELTQLAKDIGVDACLLVTPYYNKPSQNGLFQHYRAIAEAVDIPQILYNVPGRTAVDLLHDTVIALSEVDNIVAIKEATGDLERAKKLIDAVPSDFTVFSGDDATAMELMLMGGKGNISVTANVAPDQVSQLCAHAIAGNRAAAEEIDARLAPLNSALFLEANPIPVKWALQQMNKIDSGIRLPLTPLAEQYHDQVRASLQHAGLL
ncbi:4-hydroxy-tetrahydrodipicolinate synthase [Aurantivibrio plasticivorans]